MNIQKEHFALIIKYIGISFITWAISHGFFTGTRQIISAFVWVWFFVIWSLLLKKEWEGDFVRTILFASFFAIALGALTGWLQHFPDSPERSLIIVPLGFLFSVYFFFLSEGHNFWKKKHIIYTVVWFLISVIVSISFYILVEKWFFWEHTHQTHKILKIKNIDTSTDTSSLNGDQEKSTLIDTVHIDGDWHHD